MTPAFKNEDDVVLYIGSARKGLGASEYLHTLFELSVGNTPFIDLEFEDSLQKTLLKAVHSGLVNAAHDISDGGLGVTLAEMSVFSGLGAEVSVSDLGKNMHEVLYSEAQSGVVVCCRPNRLKAVISHFEESGIPVVNLGRTGGSRLKIGEIVDLAVEEMEKIYESVIPSAMDHPF